VAVLVAAAVFAAPPAGAAEREEEGGTGTRADPLKAGYFELHGTHGYRIGVAGVPAGGEHRDLVLVFTWDRDSFSAYIAPARVDEKGFQADLGRFGRVSVDFHPDGVSRLRPPCARRAFFGEAGRFVGGFSFHGEGGYTEVPGRRLRVKARHRTPFDCVSSRLERGGPGVFLETYSAVGDVQVSQPRPGAAVRIVAQSSERYKRVAVERTEESVVPASAFTWAPNLGSATLAPPPPFSGSAGFTRLGDGRTEWRGDLTGAFPGVPRVPLADDDGFGTFVHGTCRQHGRHPGGPPLAGCAAF
jgi:hypothetical protein